MLRFSIGLIFLLAWGGNCLAVSSLDGKWQQGCAHQGDDDVSATLTVEASQWSFQYMGYEDSQCQKLYFETQRVFVADIQGEELNLTVRDVIDTAWTDEVARALNLISFCGLRNWKAGEPRHVLGLNCQDVENFRPGQVIYSILRQSGRQLWIGQSDAETPGDRPDRRHRRLEDRAFETRPAGPSLP